MRNYLKGSKPAVTIILFLVIALTVLALFVFKPIHYQVPAMQQLPLHKTWNLSTGSGIAYWRLSPEISSTRTPVLYLHGGPGGCIRKGSISILKELTAQGYTVYLFDQVGGGFSARLENIKEYSVERHLKDLEEIIKLLGAQKIILIGQSWGAMLATQFAVRHPEKIEKIILTGPGPILPVNKILAREPAPDSLYLKPPASTNAIANRKVNNLRMKAVRALAISTGRKLAKDQEVDAFQTVLSQELNKSIVCDQTNAPESGLGGGYYCQLMTLKSFAEVNDYRADLKKLHCPVLILRGQCDNQPWGFTAEYLKLIPGCKLKVIPSAGHMIEVEQPTEYLRIIREFLSETP
jgi:proline iminopeptidase